MHQEIEVSIEKMAVTGEGVARHNTAVIFVPWACPGDRLKIRVDTAKKNHYSGRILEVLTPGPSRVKPPCEYAGQCGGCSWQQISHEEQLRQKQSLLHEVLHKFLPSFDFKINPIIASPLQFGYRSRIQPRLRAHELGFYRWKSHEWMPIKDCHLVEDPLRDFFKKEFKTPKPLPIDTKIELYLGTDEKPAYRALTDEVEDQLFSQVNRLQNEDLVKTVVQMSQRHKPQVIFDLYAGSGNFTFPLSAAHKSAQIIGVEANAELVRAGRKKSDLLKIPAKFLEFYATSTDLFLRRFLPDSETLVVLDPPRGGTSDFALRSFAASGLRHIIYVSCHPVSLGRDLSFLKSALAVRHKTLRIEQIQPFEMFPQTHHLETVVELSIDTQGTDANF